MMQRKSKDYKLIPMSEITAEARDIAVLWVENFEPIGGIEIEQKHKLASDIMNYATKFCSGKDWDQDFKDGVNILLAHKPEMLSLTKAAEELNELSVKLLQMVNKPDAVAIEDIQEELADVKMHLYLLSIKFKLDKKMIRKKVDKFLSSKDFLNYKAMEEVTDKHN